MKRAGHDQSKFWNRRLKKLSIFADTEKIKIGQIQLVTAIYEAIPKLVETYNENQNKEEVEFEFKRY